MGKHLTDPKHLGQEEFKKNHDFFLGNSLNSRQLKSKEDNKKLAGQVEMWLLEIIRLGSALENQLKKPRSVFFSESCFIHFVRLFAFLGFSWSGTSR